MATVREFIRQSYRLINPSNPTQPLHGDDLELGILVLNQLLQYYASNGLMLTIAHTVSTAVGIGIKYVICADATYTPASDEVLIPEGRLANMTSAWVELDGVTYPLIQQSRDEFLASFKYEPLQGLPRFLITYPETSYVRLQIYPAPSQSFEFFLRAKFQLGTLTSNSTMDALPAYYQRFLLFAVAKDMALYKGRADAWTQRLEEEFLKSEKTIQSASEVNLSITGDRASLLNGAWRVRAGI
jgi:hypothetical protein